MQLSRVIAAIMNIGYKYAAIKDDSSYHEKWKNIGTYELSWILLKIFPLSWVIAVIMNNNYKYGAIKGDRSYHESYI